ncbi:MAG: undecaprenyldiphospho-muramoylpentapeptide beta-N-acetylglucosaminyltransferase [Pseudonocardiaceae bacterium]|nr:undecaprenyldiphospho-muramoylpentapeptide beta-N-acetylglucosaminyltransferase [Pseudonocardiaceae bacterium]
MAGATADLAAPGTGHIRAAHPVRAGHGAVGVERPVLHAGRLVLCRVHPPSGVLRRRADPVLDRPAAAGRVPAGDQPRLPAGVHRDAGAGAHAAGRRVERGAELVAARAGIDSARRAGEAGAGDVGGPGPGDQACPAGPVAPPAGATRSGVGGGLRTGDAAARHGHDDGAGDGAAGTAVVRRCACRAVRGDRRRRDGRRDDHGRDRRLPLGADRVVPQPDCRTAGRRLPGTAGALLAGRGGLVGCGAGPGQRQVGLSAQRPQRLHLRDHRGGAGLPGLPGGAAAVRHPRLHRAADRRPQHRPVDQARDGHDHHVAGGPGRDQHRLRGGAAAGHRAAAPDDLVRRDLAGVDHVQLRPAGQLRPARAAGGGGAALRHDLLQAATAATAGALPAATADHASRCPTSRRRRTPEGSAVSGGAPLSVVLAGGGTAGHVEPALALADALRRMVPEARITALGTERGIETRLVPERGYPLELVPPVPLPRRPHPDLLRLPLRLRSAVRRTREVLGDTGADVVVGFGGYVALPAYLAARGRLPIVVHEANARAGLANKIGARFAGRVAAAVPGTGLPGVEVIGMPLSRSISTLDRAGLRAKARAHFGLHPEAPTLLVTGGSQGARSLNIAVSDAAPALASAGIGVLHAHGARNAVAVQPVAGAPPYVAVPYLDRMDLGLAAADLAICRSGAMTVAELSAVGLPAVFVPLPHGNGEQALNARELVDAGGAVLVADAELTPERVVREVVGVLTDQRRLAAMSTAARVAGHPEADATLARIVLEVAE